MIERILSRSSTTSNRLFPGSIGSQERRIDYGFVRRNSEAPGQGKQTPAALTRRDLSLSRRRTTLARGKLTEENPLSGLQVQNPQGYGGCEQPAGGRGPGRGQNHRWPIRRGCFLYHRGAGLAL